LSSNIAYDPKAAHFQKYFGEIGYAPFFSKPLWGGKFLGMAAPTLRDIAGIAVSVMSCGAGGAAALAINLIDDVAFTAIDVAMGNMTWDEGLVSLGKAGISSVVSSQIGNAFGGAMVTDPGSIGDVVNNTLVKGMEKFTTNMTVGAINSIEYRSGGEFGFNASGYVKGLIGTDALASYAGAMGGEFVKSGLQSMYMGKATKLPDGTVVSYAKQGNASLEQMNMFKSTTEVVGNLAYAGVEYGISGHTTVNILNFRDIAKAFNWTWFQNDETGAWNSVGMFELTIDRDRGISSRIGEGGIDLSIGNIVEAFQGLSIFNQPSNNIISLNPKDIPRAKNPYEGFDFDVEMELIGNQTSEEYEEGSTGLEQGIEGLEGKETEEKKETKEDKEKHNLLAALKKATVNEINGLKAILAFRSEFREFIMEGENTDKELEDAGKYVFDRDQLEDRMGKFTEEEYISYLQNELKNNKELRKALSIEVKDGVSDGKGNQYIGIQVYFDDIDITESMDLKKQTLTNNIRCKETGFSLVEQKEIYGLLGYNTAAAFGINQAIFREATGNFLQPYEYSFGYGITDNNKAANNVINSITDVSVLERLTNKSFDDFAMSKGYNVAKTYNTLTGTVDGESMYYISPPVLDNNMAQAMLEKLTGIPNLCRYTNVFNHGREVFGADAFTLENGIMAIKESVKNEYLFDSGYVYDIEACGNTLLKYAMLTDPESVQGYEYKQVPGTFTSMSRYYDQMFELFGPNGTGGNIDYYMTNIKMSSPLGAHHINFQFNTNNVFFMNSDNYNDYINQVTDYNDDAGFNNMPTGNIIDSYDKRDMNYWNREYIKSITIYAWQKKYINEGSDW